MKDFNKLFVGVILLLAVAVFMVPISNITTNPDSRNNKHRIEVIDEKIDTVIKLAAGSTAASAVVSMLPGDTGTPIAEELAELGKFFLLVLSALYLEKYLVTVTGLVAFKVLIPIAIVLFGMSFWFSKAFWRSIAVKLVICAIAIHFIVPISVKISDVIYENYSDKIQETVDISVDVTESTQSSESEGLIDWISGKTTEVLNSFSELMSNFLDALAVMVVTSCLIPILVILIIGWLIKTLFVVNLPINTITKFDEVITRGKKKEEAIEAAE